MAAEDTDSARLAAKAFERGDLEGALEGLDPAAEFRLPAGAGPPDHAYRGVAGARAAIRRWIGDWDAYQATVERYLPAPEGAVVVLATERGYDRDADMRVERRPGAVVTFRSGHAVRVRVFETWPEALEEAGLDAKLLDEAPPPVPPPDGRS